MCSGRVPSFILLGIMYHFGSKVGMSQCQIVEVRNLEDAGGYSCAGATISACSDCGIELCKAHAEACGMCEETFCPSCLTIHQKQHLKPATEDRGNRGRKIA